MKTETLNKRTKIANDILYYIYTHIDTDINIDELSHDLKVSKFHMHRIFKEAFGKNIYENIKDIRLQKASNLLITNKNSTISSISNQCGYSSQSSFIRVFKQRFNMTPKEWKNGKYKEFSQEIISQSTKSLLSNANFDLVEPTIVEMPTMNSYYIRHSGYDMGIKKTWQKLYTWVLNNKLKNYKEIALYHDNPTITPFLSCQYIACIVPEEGAEILSDKVPKFRISGGTYAKFDLTGVYGDPLRFIRWVYHEWFPQSGFETTTKPSFAIYHKNHFLNSDGQADLSFYVSINY